MKKLISLLLALLMLATAVSMVGCGKDKTPDDPDAENPDVEQPGDETPDEPDAPAEPEDEIVFTTVDEKVKAIVTVELRVAPSVDIDNVIGNLRVGEIATRTGISAEWSRIRVEAEGFDDEYYVSTNCLELYTGTTEPDQSETPDEPEQPETPDEPETPATDADGFTAVTPETVYVITNGLNLRTAPTTSDPLNIAGSALIGTALQRTATNGDWSRVTYMGGQYYVYSKYVVTTDITGSNFITLTSPVVTTVTAAQSLHTRTVPYFADDPDIDGDTSAGVLLRGAAVTVVAEAPDKTWVRIRTTEGTECYVKASYLAAYGGATNSPAGGNSGTSSGTTTPTTPAVTFTVLNTPVALYPKEGGVRVYVQPDILSNAVDTLTMSDKIFGVAVSTDGDWYKVQISATDTVFYYVQAAKMQTNGK